MSWRSLLTYLFLSFAAYAEETVLFDESNPPFMYVKNEEIHGLYPVLIKEIYKRMQVPVKLYGMPWQRALQQLDDGKAAVAGIYKTKDRLNKYDFTDALYVERLSLYTRKENAFAYKSLADLKGKTLGVVLGWSLGDEFDQAHRQGLFTTMPSASDAQNFEKLKMGRIDVVIAIRESGDAVMKSYRGSIVRLPRSMAENSVYVAFNKSRKKENIVKSFNQQLIAVKKEGIYQKIIKEQLR